VPLIPRARLASEIAFFTKLRVRLGLQPVHTKRQAGRALPWMLHQLASRGLEILR